MSSARIDRRRFLAGAAAAAAAGAAGALEGAPGARGLADAAGPVSHILPTASSDRLLVKVSLTRAETAPPQLRVGKRTVEGRRIAVGGRFWFFDAAGLEAATRYELSLHRGSGERLGEPWPLSTLPKPTAAVERMRLLAFTCAGGPGNIHIRGQLQFLTIPVRRRLLERALSFRPDAVVANGDHIYWDQRTVGGGQGIRSIPEAIAFAGEFDRTLPVLGTPNEQVLCRVGDSQVAELYGTLLRSVPVFFLQDDHDYFEGDKADDAFVSFPPDPFMLALARATQGLYYPEFLPDSERAAGIGSSSAADRPPGVSECFGTLRWGRLLELVLYDCRRYMSLKGPTGAFIPEEAESWLAARAADDQVAHLVHVPSVPVGWSAGKWGEWYPDALERPGVIGTSQPKPYWQQGWLRQHDRILTAVAAGRRRPVFVNGDLHSIAEGTIYRSGTADFRSNPVFTLVTGPLGTSRGWPSAGRGTRGQHSTVLDMKETVPCIEENGFVLADVTPDRIVVRYFRWNPADGEAAIDALEPFRTTELPVSRKAEPRSEEP